MQELEALKSSSDGQLEETEISWLWWYMNRMNNRQTFGGMGTFKPFCFLGLTRNHISVGGMLLCG